MSEAPNQSPRVLQVRKYTNRRFYDVTRSRNLTLADLHALICEGYDLQIIDSKSGQEITNAVLTQIILERESPKLAIFPAAILHQVIRTQQQFLGGVVEQFFRQALAAQRASQEQWARFLQNTLGTPAETTPNPLDWTRRFMEAFGGSPPPGAAAPSAPGATPPTLDEDDELSQLRRQVAELNRKMERLARETEPTPRRRRRE